MQYAVLTEIGLRNRNEDSAYIPIGVCGAPVVAVADGMGGHRAGCVASELAVHSIVEYIEGAPVATSDERLINEAVKAANRAVHTLASNSSEYNGMGTTIVAALLYPDRFIAANVGDSRIYHYDGDKLVLVSHDHSLVAELVEIGAITMEQARTHPYRNMITRALGTDENARVDVFSCIWNRGDTLLLCSDGLHGYVSDERMADIMGLEIDLAEMGGMLVKAALENGSSDNITVVLARNSEDDQ